MTLKERIHTLGLLGESLQNDISWKSSIAITTELHNPWFTKENTGQALDAIADNFLSQALLEQWVQNYKTPEMPMKRIGLVLAGNIPLVGWHDVLCTFVAGHKSVIKYSSKDNVSIPALIDRLIAIHPESASYFESVESLKDIDAVIATGGDTAATHFKHYFAKYPHIIRKNRNSVAVLSGEENTQDLMLVISDIMGYFGLGCRSVSKIYLPHGWPLDLLFEASLKHADNIHHSKYKNNYDYNHAMYLLSQQDFVTNDFLIMIEDQALASRIACLHYQRYGDLQEVISDLQRHEDELQCVSSKIKLEGIKTVPLGQCQQPGLEDYADNIDIMHFLTHLS